ncbi:MAG: HDOD domain-containing protein, partial [Deltaproteobacteria bacterium]|nr:HDOD domain-containing protein [Deltaproteobacteria bacterium]
VSLSYRLLRYINSPGFGLGVKVESIRRAVAMMGSRALRRWLRVTIMSDLDQSGRGYALVSLSAQRAMYLQALGRCATTECRDDPDGLFLLGFFSLLGALLDQSMEELIDHLPLDSWLKTALIDPSAPEAAWLRLVEAQERGDWERVAEYLDRLGLDPVHSAEQYYQARIWADSVLGSSRGSI